MCKVAIAMRFSVIVTLDLLAHNNEYDVRECVFTPSFASSTAM